MHDTERVEGLASLLNELHNETKLNYSANCFKSRFTIQKTIYLLKCLDNPIAKQYDFSTYIRGPYSKALADDYYGVKKLRSAPKLVATLRPEDVSLIKAVFAKNDLFVEAVATIHSVRDHNPGISVKEVINHVRSMKPHLSEQLLDEAWGFLLEKGLAK